MLNYVKGVKHYSQRVSQPSARKVFPPHGMPLIQIHFSHWRFFTSANEREWGSVFLSESDAQDLLKSLVDAVNSDENVPEN